MDYRLILLDIDGTIAPRDSVEIYPAARRFIEALDAVQVALVTNQDGPACYDAGWPWSEATYPSLEQVEARLAKITQALPEGRHYEIFVAYAYKQKNGVVIAPTVPANGFNFWASIDPTWRKPSPIMIFKAMKEFGISNCDHVLMIGDRPEDRGAAAAAGVAFRHADDI